MARYARLKQPGFDTDDSELFEVGELDVDFVDKLTEGDAVPGHSSEAECTQQQQQKSIRDHLYTVPSTELATEIFSKLQNSKLYADNRLAQQQQKLQEKQNIENGNPNVCPPDPTAQPTVVAICSHSSIATGASLQEQPQLQGGGGVRGGASPSGRWVGRKLEERSGRARTMGCESYLRDNSSSVLDYGNVNSSAPSSRPTCAQWTPFTQRGTSHRDPEPVLDDQSQEPFSSRGGAQPQHSHSQEKKSCSLHSSCIDIRNSQRTKRFSKESTLRDDQFNAPIPGPEKRSLPSVMHPRSDASSCGPASEERDPNFHRSSSAREAIPGLQRSSSTGQRSETSSTENWRDYPASKSSHVSDRTKHRVSFSLTDDDEVETQKLREKFREPIAPCKKVLQAKQQQTTSKEPLRYNYEQPGFVEREKENICAGKAYTIYGVNDVKDCPKGSSSGRHHQLVRAFSLREKNGSNYTKMPRAYSVNAGGRHVMPMECDTCGKGGVGIVFLGVPGDDANSCRACSCGESKAPKKKKSIMAYCRKILRLTPKPR